MINISKPENRYCGPCLQTTRHEPYLVKGVAFFVCSQCQREKFPVRALPAPPPVKGLRLVVA
jgi:NADH pyrophosphatase NudC (nudix superfamily)